MKEPDQPLISIIMPTFNVGPYIDQCLASIEAQTYLNLELIIVDDGSDDGTFEKCQAYASSHSNVRIFSTSNKGSGCAAARNIGLKEVSGDYIGFIDGDDWLEPALYEKLLSAIRSNADKNVSISSSGFYNAIPSDPQSEIKDIYSDAESILSSHDAVKCLIEDATIQSYLWNKLFKKELFTDIEFPIQRAYSDLATVYKLFLKSEAIATVPEPLYYYRQWNGSISRTGNIQKNFNLHDAYLNQLKDIATIYPDLEEAIRIRNLNLELSTCFFYRKQNSEDRNSYSKEIHGILMSIKENKINLESNNRYSALPLGTRFRIFVVQTLPLLFGIH